MTGEPAALGGAIVVLVNALLGAVVLFGVHLTGDQVLALVGVVNAVLAVLVALGVRSLVTPTGGRHVAPDA